MAPGIYGIDMIAEARSGNEPCILTSDYQEFLTLYVVHSRNAMDVCYGSISIQG